MGIKSLFNNNCEVVLGEEVSLIDPLTNKEFLSVEYVENLDNSYISNKKPIGNVAKANMLMQQLPLAVNIAQNQIVKGAYKVIIPEGATGSMIRYKNGMLGTPLISVDGKVTSHAGLVRLDGVSLNPLMVFTAMSAITGQYFMARIDKSLDNISKDVKNIVELIYDEKESEALTAYNFYESIKNNIQVILGNETLKIASLTNVQSSNNKMYSNIIFYSKSINRDILNLNKILVDSKLTGKRLSKMEEISNKISEMMKQQYLCYELFCIGKTYEIQIGEIYDKVYYTNLINELEYIGNIIDKDIYSLLDKSRETLLQIIKDATIKGNDAINKFNKDTEDYSDKQQIFKMNKEMFLDNIKNFNIENQKSKEFIVVGETLYM